MQNYGETMKEYIKFIPLFLLGIAFSTSISGVQIIGVLFILYYIFLSIKKDISVSDFPYWKPVGIILVAMGISTAFSVNKMHSLKHVHDVWQYLFIPFGFFLIMRGANFKRIVFSLCVGSIIAAVYSVHFYQIHPELGRARGFYTTALTYGNVLAFVLVIITVIILKKLYTSRAELFFLLITAFFNIVGLYTSMSRGPMLAIFITIILMIIVSMGKKGIIFALIAVMFCTAFVIITPKMRTRFTSIVTKFHEQNSPVWTRMRLMEISVQIVKEHPLTGIGEANFRPVAKAHDKIGLGSLSHAHNSYLQFMVIHGIIGFAALMYFLYTIFIMAYKNRKSFGGLTLLGVFTVFFLGGMTENSYTDSEVFMLFAFLVGLFTAIIKKENTGHIIK